MQKNIKKAFTLVETLLTLLIFGVIAMITIPVLNNSATISKYQTQFAVVVKDTNDLFTRYTNKNKCGGSLACTGLFSYSNKDSDIRNELVSLLNVTLQTEDCWSSDTATKLNGQDKVDLNKEGACWIDGQNRIFSIITLSTESQDNCTFDLRADDTKKTKPRSSCGYLIVDIDGNKGPNTFGKDVYAFIITDAPGNYLYPVGGKLVKSSYKNLTYWNGTTKTCQGNDEGRTCAARLVDNHWKIDYFK